MNKDAANLAELRDTLLTISPDDKPSYEDGVQITAAPLWPLFRHKPWHKVLKETWEKLEQGEYDWGYLAMTYWSERVRDECGTDKSLDPKTWNTSTPNPSRRRPRSVAVRKA